ncbi:MAG: hypothetical protein ACE5G0_07940 [Rhodothermales bacterium]
MLALVALMITVFFAMSQQRGIVESQLQVASIELEVLANAVGSEVMQQIGVKPFDAATVGVNPINVTLAGLTPSTNFGTGLDCPSACDDIDDFNEMQPFTTFFEIGRDEEGVPYGFNFTVTASVTYVDDAGNATTSLSWTKEVTLSVDQAVTGSERKHLMRPIQLSQQFSLQ